VPELLVERDGPIAILTLDRPEKRNALSISLRRSIADAADELSGDDSVSVLILTGAPPAFCAGMDVNEFGGDEDHRRDLVESSERLFSSIGTFPLPVIGAINGPAMGGGCALAAACDIRVASPSARFGHPENARGIPVAYAALSRMLPEAIARAFAFTGKTIDAQEALSFGMVLQVADDVVAAARAMGAQIARIPRHGLLRTKELVLAATAASPSAHASAAQMQMFRASVLPGEQR
jgi:3-hydroxypropionyl-coenzyme A dehydratase